MADPAHIRYPHKPFPGSSHTWTLQHLAALAPSSRVLDVGCGSGSIGVELRAHGWDQLCAVEVDPQTQEHARAIYNRVEASLDSFFGERFDVILLLDVLEHMAEPEAFLSQVSRLGAQDAKILVSVPNIAHWSIRALLLCGDFEYRDRGILDRTHLRFFTRRAALQLLDAAEGYTLKAMAGSVSPAELVLPQWISGSAAFRGLTKVRQLGVRVAPALCSYQHLAILERSATQL